MLSTSSPSGASCFPYNQRMLDPRCGIVRLSAEFEHQSDPIGCRPLQIHRNNSCDLVWCRFAWSPSCTRVNGGTVIRKGDLAGCLVRQRLHRIVCHYSSPAKSSEKSVQIAPAVQLITRRSHVPISFPSPTIE